MYIILMLQLVSVRLLYLGLLYPAVNDPIWTFLAFGKVTQDLDPGSLMQLCSF